MIRERLKTILKILKISSICGTGGFFIYYHINQTCKSLKRIVNPNVLEQEKKVAPEYIYIDDPSYDHTLKMEQDKESKQSVGIARIWKSLKHSLAWRLLWLCRHGNNEQRNVALDQLASFKNNKNWDCLKLAQALDWNTAVLLARTRGVDLRYFLPPPIHVRRAALTPELMSFKFKDLIVAAQAVNPHCCIQHFLSKYFVNVQEQAMEADSILTKPDSISERDLCLLCLDALHHHVSLFHTTDFNEDISATVLIKMGLFPILAEVLLRYRYDSDIDLAVLKILTVLSSHKHLVETFFQNGLIGELARWIKSKDVKLASSAAVSLVNLSGEGSYRPGLYLLHPLYRSRSKQICDVLLVHGLSGGVFVTWRQRDRKISEPLGIIAATVNDDDVERTKPDTSFIDPELQQVMEDIIELEEESLLLDYDVVLEDTPIEAKDEKLDYDYDSYVSSKKRIGLNKELEDRAGHSYCWPKDWLPKDMNNLRVMGINYWSSLSEWLERCPLQTADIEIRAAEITPALVEAGVGRVNVPVVWLAHSMGGLIVKQLLTKSAQSTDQTEMKISENTKAIVFYSTPHKGSALATMPRAAAAILWPSNDVRQLTQNSPVLLTLHTDFLKYAEKYQWETICFAETMPTLVTAFKVPIHFVEAASAELGRGLFYKLPLDHLAICKPATRQSLLYTTVLDVLRRVTAKDEKINFSNPYFKWLMDILNTIYKEEMDSSDDTQNENGLRWFDKVLLDAFTDGFTD